MVSGQFPKNFLKLRNIYFVFSLRSIEPKYTVIFALYVIMTEIANNASKTTKSGPFPF